MAINDIECMLVYNDQGLVVDWGPANDINILGEPVPQWKLLKVFFDVRVEFCNGPRVRVDEGWIERGFFWVREWTQIRSVHNQLFGWDGYKYLRFRVETHLWNAIEGWRMFEED